MRSRLIVATIALMLIAAGLWLFLHKSGTSTMVSGSDPLPFSFATQTESYTVAIDAPATGNSALDAAVRAHIDAQAAEFEDAEAPGRLSAQELESIKESGYPYEFDIKGEPWTFGGISGIWLEEYRYTGGAHGGTTMRSFAYDAKGKALSLSDLFTSGEYLKRISAALRPALKEKMQSADMYVEDMFLTGTDPSEGNYLVFKISGSGITFYFNEYQVAPYAAGPQEATVPLDDLKDILSPEYF